MVLVLLLLNGVFFAWQYYGAHGKTAAQHATDAKGEYEPLTLISELSPEQRQALGVTPKDGSTAPQAEGEAKAKAKAPVTAEAPQAGETKMPEQPVETPAEAPPKHAEGSAEPSKPEPEAKAPVTAAPAQAEPMPPKPKHQGSADKPHCYALGPMGNQKMVKQVKLRVSSMGLTVEEVRNEVEKVPTNWIYLGPIKGEAEAKRVEQRLHAKGVKDTQLINKGANNYVISVGLFSTKQGADERLKRLQDAGFTPNISQVTAKKSHYWLDVSYNGGKVVDKKILTDMVRGVRGAGVKEIECKPR